jgi:hypothetical protein
MTTKPADAMAAVVTGVAPLLKAAGFRKKRHTFNRSVEPGMVHVVNFQMGSYEPPGTTDVAPFRVSTYGKFTVNLGVYVSEMVIEESLRPKNWVHEYDCQLRMRLGQLFGEDVWWPLDDPTEATSLVQTGVGTAGLPWLDRFSSRAELVETFWRDGREALGMTPRGPVEVAWLLAETDREVATDILRAYAREDHSPQHREWLEVRLKDAGFGQIVDR